MTNHGGKRARAGRKAGEPSRSVRIPESMMRAAQSLQRIAKGKGADTDIAEILVAINLSTTDWNGVVGWDEMDRAVRQLKNSAYKENDWDRQEALQAQADDLEDRVKKVSLG